ncbi:MAG: TetR/AcrR family transcriptional regulator [Pseudomonadota bacterium]
MPKVVDKEEMRHRIMDAAMIVYSDVGFHVATMDAIAKQSGLGKGTVYLYFKSKEALTVALVDRIFSGMEENFFSDSLCGSLEEFKALLRKTMDIPKEHAAFVRVFFEVFGPSFASKDFVKKVAGFFDRLGNHYADHVALLQQQGQLSRSIEPKATGRALAAMIDGIILHKGLFAMSPAKHRKLIDASLKLIFPN